MNHFNSLFPKINNSNQSLYYNIDEFKCRFSNTGINLMHLNVCSLLSKLDIMDLFLTSLGDSLDIICLTETWLNTSTVHLVGFPKYNMFHVMRDDGRRGGGVSILVDRRMKGSKIANLCRSCESIECIFVEILMNGVKILVGSMYRPPSADINEFHEQLNSILSSINSTMYKLVIIGGDFNMNLLRVDSDNNCLNFVNIMFSKLLLPVITKPTRVSNDSISLIDNLFLNNQSDCISGIIPCDISDHYLIFINFMDLFSSESYPKSQNIRFRKLANDNFVNLRAAASNHNFDHIVNCEDVNDAILMLKDELMYLYDLYCPVVVKNISYKDKVKPWIDREAKLHIRLRQKYHILSAQGKMNRVEYCRYRNMVTAEIRMKRKNYYSLQFENKKGDMRATWNIINNIIKPHSKSNNNKIKLKIDDVLTDDSVIISDRLNEYFSNVGSDINKQFDSVPEGSFKQFLSGSYRSSFFLRPVSEAEVGNIISSLKNKSCNIDVIPFSVLKLLEFIIAPILTVLINNSFPKGVFPQSLKIARIVCTNFQGR